MCLRHLLDKLENMYYLLHMAAMFHFCLLLWFVLQLDVFWYGNSYVILWYPQVFYLLNRSPWKSGQSATVSSHFTLRASHWTRPSSMPICVTHSLSTISICSMIFRFVILIAIKHECGRGKTVASFDELRNLSRFLQSIKTLQWQLQ